MAEKKMAIVAAKGETVPIGKLSGWDRNPRDVDDEDFERLKRQIVKLGVYKPLLVDQKYVVLGGNMRLRAWQELGVKSVWVSVVQCRNDEDRLAFALSDNDRAGFYVEDRLVPLLQSAGGLDLPDFKIDLGVAAGADDVLASFMRSVPAKKGSGADADVNHGAITLEMEVTCPKCKYAFKPHGKKKDGGRQPRRRK